MVNRPSLGHMLSSVSTWPSADSVESHTRAQKVRVLYRHGPPAQLLSIVAAGVICWVLWAHVRSALLITWWIGVTAITGGRMVLAQQFARRNPEPIEMLSWERLFVFSLAASTLTWGVGGWLIMPADSPIHQAVVYFFLMGVAGGAVAAYGVHAVASTIAVCSLMLPATVAFAATGSLELRVMAAGGVLYLAAALRSTRSFGFFLERTFQLSHELRLAYDRARHQARTDELTGLANRRAFMLAGASAVDQAQRYGRDLTVLMMDIDHFKQINDTYGHAAGDAALRSIGMILRRTARSADTPGRLGGEEFALLLPETSPVQATVVAERLRVDVKELVVHHEGNQFRLTCSVGVAGCTKEMRDVDVLLHAADQALYKAKSAGRDRVVED